MLDPTPTATMPRTVPTVLAVLGAGVLDPDSAVARADDAGLTRGDGCFEGVRVRVDAAGIARVDKLDAHLARMARSAAGLELPFDPAAWRALVADAVAAWARTAEPGASGEATMKLLLSRGAPDGEPTGFAWLTPITAATLALRQRGLHVVTLSRGVASDAFAGSPWLLGGVKTLSYAINMAAQREAERRGADDVIFRSTDGYVLEAPTGSVVWARGRVLATTPTGDTGILPGTTQQLLFERAATAGWSVADELLPVADLAGVDALWVVSSVRGPVEVITLDGVARTRRPDLDAEIRALCGF